MSMADSLAHDPLAEEFEQVVEPAQGDDDTAMMGAGLPAPTPPGIQDGEAAMYHAHPAPPMDEPEDDDDDLFGDADGDGPDEEAEAEVEMQMQYRDVDEERDGPGAGGFEDDGRDLDGLTSPERTRRKQLEYEEDSGEEQEVVSKTEAEVDIPKLPVPQVSDGKFWMLHLPNYVTIDSKPFEPATYAGPEMTDRDVLDAPTPEAKAQKVQEMSHFIQYQVKNALRWRWVRGPDGEMRKVSNSRVVRWSDNTLSFQVGTEFWDVTQNAEEALTSRDTSFVVQQHAASGVLEVQAALTGSMALRPTGLNSRTHRDLVRAIGQKHSKIAKLRMTSDGDRAPEALLRDLLKEDNKAEARRRTKERVADGGGRGTPRRRRSGARARAGREQSWSDEEEYQEEDEEDEEGTGVGVRRKRSSSGKGAPKEGKRAGSYEEDDFLVKDTDDEDGGDAEAAGEGDGAGEDEDEDERSSERRPRKRARTKRDQSGDGGRAAAGGPKDAVDEAEEVLEEELRKRRKARAARKEKKEDPASASASGANPAAEEDMDVDEPTPTPKLEKENQTEPEEEVKEEVPAVPMDEPESEEDE